MVPSGICRINACFIYFCLKIQEYDFDQIHLRDQGDHRGRAYTG
jgi:hypothetical protein